MISIKQPTFFWILESPIITRVALPDHSNVSVSLTLAERKFVIPAKAGIQ